VYFGVDSSAGTVVVDVVAGSSTTVMETVAERITAPPMYNAVGQAACASGVAG
jgi:hypothetical protein